MYILGLNSYGHDSSVCLLKDGAPVFAACEERFNRKKHYQGFPEMALRYCLREANISFEEIEYKDFSIWLIIFTMPQGLRTYAWLEGWP